MRPLYANTEPGTDKGRRRLRLSCALLLLLLIAAGSGQAQVGLMLNLAPVDGIPLTPDNVFAFTLQSNMPSATDAVVRGSLRYREGGHYFTYSFRTTVRPGLNRFERATVRPEWTYSGAAFRELFQDYQVLPQGTYEYCVSVNPIGSNGEVKSGEEVSECLYSKSDDLFLINLVDPENNAKLHEHYPVLSWIANYPFASQLTYRIRVAEIREGQNAVNAVVRNNPVYTESNLPQTTTTYPVYGTPLKTFQPYAWTVDAYYKDILLGGAEPWKFTIVEDSEMVGIPREVSYLDIRNEKGERRAYAIGKLKLKYILEDLKTDLLNLQLYSGNEAITMKNSSLQARQGDNRYELDFYTANRLHHLQTYTLTIESQSGEKFTVQFKYINPDFL